MPDWRHGIYYFRRVRKLSTLELSIAISIIISIGHYFVLWAQHFEKKLTLVSIIEASFTVADKNKDGEIDIREFVYFVVNNLPKEIRLKDMNEALKMVKLYDENNDDKLSPRGIKLSVISYLNYLL